MSVLPRLLAAALVLSATPIAQAYEGAGLMRESEPEPTPAPTPQLTRPPAPLEMADAVYPPELLEAGEGGEVVLIIDIAADGTVPRAEVSRSSGQPAFDEAARQALLQSRFVPAELDGQPGAVRLEYLYRFEPPAPPPEEAPEPPVNLRGRVLERGTREPLAGANVYLPEANLLAETDQNGAFELRGVPAGQVAIEVSGSRHRRLSVTEEVKDGEVTELTLYLWKQIEGGFEVTVRGQREKKEVARRTLERAELTTVPGTFGDPLRVIQNLPGMARAPYVSGALLVRGAQPQDTGVLVDGVPIPLLYHFAGGPSVLAPSYIDRIDFFPGAYGAKYGRAIAGIVDVTTRPAEVKSLHGTFDVDLFDAGFYVEGPVSKEHNWGTWSLAARRSYIDVFLPTLLDLVRTPGEAALVASPKYWDYQARYDLQLGRDRFEVSLFGSDDQFDLSQAGDAETEGITLGSRQGFHRARVRYGRRLADGVTLSVAPTFGVTLTDLSLGDQVNLDIWSWDLNTRAALNAELSKAFNLEVGLDLNANMYRLDFKLPGLPEWPTLPGARTPVETVEQHRDITLASYAAYTELVWQPIEGLRFIPGLRFELYDLPRGPTPSLEPRVAARWDVHPRITTKAAWGLYRQAAEPRNFDDSFGNPKLGLQQSSQTAGGVELKLLDRLTLDLQGYYNWRTHLVVGSDEVVERDGKQVVERLANRGRGQSYGLEVLLKQELTQRMYGWVAYTLSRSVQYDPSDERYEPTQYDQTHLLTVVGSYKFDWGIEAGLRFRLTTGRPTTVVVGSTFDSDLLDYDAIYSGEGEPRTATFHQLDVRVEKLWTFETWTLSTFLDIQNVYNAENPELYVYDYRYKKQAPVRGLPFLPTLGVMGSF